MTCPELGDADRLYPRMIIDALPDDVLLETFEFYLGKDDIDRIDYDHIYDGWHKIVHVCRRWRCIVFSSPRRLDLKLCCTPHRSINSETLDIWPALPIVILSPDVPSDENATNIIAALRHHNQVCKIYYVNGPFQDSVLEEFAAIDEPFPALTSLELVSYGKFGQNVPVLPDSFLGGSAPRLRSLHLHGIPYPSIGMLLSSTTNLARLSLSRIPRSGYISPETIVPFLSALSRLESLVLGFQHPRSEAQRANRRPPPLTRIAFPNLTSLDFHGDMEYLEDVLSQIEAPILHYSKFDVFNQLMFDTPLLGHFIRRTETFIKIHTASVRFSGWSVKVTLSGLERVSNTHKEALQVGFSCKPMDWQLSAVAQVLNSFSSSLSTLESLDIEVSHDDDWQGEIEVAQWQEFLHPFSAVKDMALVFEDSVRLVAPALQELDGEREIEVLLGLQNIFLKTHGWQPTGPPKEAIEQFVATRQLYGHPVIVHY